MKDDAEFLAGTRAMVARGKASLSALFTELGLEHLCGEGHYMMVRTPQSDTLLQRKLLRRGIMVRSMTGFRFPDWIRISVVQEPVLQEFRTAFRDLLAKPQTARPRAGNRPAEPKQHGNKPVEAEGP